MDPSTLERIRSIRDQMNEIEKRTTDESLTLEELERLDGEWDMLDAELAMYDELLQLDQAQQAWEVGQLEEPIEEDNQPPQEEEWWLNPSDEDVARWDAERASWTNENLYGNETFDLADEV
jgi:hypothetical protein